MAVSRIHGLYGVGVGSTLLGGITSSSMPTGTEFTSDPAGGMVEPHFVAINAQKPSATFATLAVASAINAIGTQGTSISVLTGGLSFYAQKHKDGGTRDATAVHKKYNMTEGVITIGTLDAAHQDNATVNCNVAITHDGTANPPIFETDLQTLPSGLLDSERFTLGAVTVGGILLPQVRSVNIEFGIEVTTEGADSDIWDTFASIRTISPVITIQGVDMDWFKESGAIPFAGKAALHTDTTIWLRARKSGGTIEANNVAKHIRITTDGIAYIDEPSNVSGANAIAESTLKIQSKYDVANSQSSLLIFTGQTI